MRRMHDILEENGFVKSIDGLPVINVITSSGSTNTFNFVPETGKSYLCIGLGKTDVENQYDEDMMFIWNYNDVKSYNSVAGKMRITAGDPLIQCDFYEAEQLFAIELTI